VISALYESVQKQGNERMLRLDVNGRAYLSQVVPIMRKLGEAEYLGMVVPVDEVTAPITASAPMRCSTRWRAAAGPAALRHAGLHLARSPDRPVVPLALRLRDIDTKDLE